MRLPILLMLLLPVSWAKCPTDTVCDKILNKCYKYMDEVQPYFEAEVKCVSMGGHLVSIHSTSESTFVGEPAASMFNGNDDYWIGANYLVNNKWSWTDNTPWNYEIWLEGTPVEDTTAAVLLAGNMWMTSDPNGLKPYVCQLPYSSSDDLFPTTTHSPIPPTPLECPIISHTPHCDNGWTLFDHTNSCYKVEFNEKFYAAEKVCNQLGGHLASIHDQKENDFVSNLAYSGRTVEKNDCTWFGMYRVNGQFYWTDKSPVTFSNWGPGDYSSGDCVLVFVGGWTAGPGWNNKWQTHDCSDIVRNFVCKKRSL